MTDDLVMEELLAAARAARERSYVPYSGFRMGAAVAAGGRVHPGAVVESVSLGLAMCAERVAVFAAVAAGATGIDALALVSRRTSGTITTPCGACLQVLVEHAAPGCVVVCEDVAGEQVRYELATLAPHLPRKH
jgi:cytidine deaminase